MGRTQQDDARLVTGLVSGNREAFENVYRRHNAAMVRLATTILRNRASAEEIAQDAWLSVLRNIASFEGRSSLAGWIFTILTNKARTRAQRDGRSISFDEDGDEDNLSAAFDGRGRWKNMPELWEEMTPETIVAGRDILTHVNSAIQSLPPAQRAVLILRGQQGLEAKEVCSILEISEGNLRVLLHRARFALRAAIDRLVT